MSVDCFFFLYIIERIVLPNTLVVIVIFPVYHKTIQPMDISIVIQMMVQEFVFPDGVARNVLSVCNISVVNIVKSLVKSH